MMTNLRYFLVVFIKQMNLWYQRGANAMWGGRRLSFSRYLHSLNYNEIYNNINLMLYSNSTNPRQGWTDVLTA